ncbi:RidA family protein [Marinicauda algicola]|uniref:RidA family protein n=1 Tax=Marinicauda algicola TaxID=2029849 RepID=A0A4V3RYB2_9PROT|nr:RidA family protein [Marinicauda algicola]TGY89789.1 RidA family protein [Marinicauda algicola]
MTSPESRLAELGLTLPEAAAPVANYVPFVQSGNLVHVSGQVSKGRDGLIAGRVGTDLTLDEAKAAARVCALNLIAQLKAACGGDLSKVKRIVRLGGYVNADPAFTDIPQVINGASDLMVEVFGEAGRHARSAIGCAVLPLNAAVEVDAVVEVE